MVFIDVHCHLDFFDEKKLKKAVESAHKKGVSILVSNGTNLEANRRIIEISEKYKNVKVALGGYPLDMLKLSQPEIDDEIEFIRENKNKVIAIGEVGLDLKENKNINNLSSQMETFGKFIALSKELNIPIIVHSRKAEAEAIQFLEDMKAKKVVMHCFSGSMKLVERIVKNGWMLSIPASINYIEHFQNVVKLVSINNLLCETDSPFLHPLRKKDNTPENVIFSYKKIAEIKGISLKEAEKKIEENFRKLFEKI